MRFVSALSDDNILRYPMVSGNSCKHMETTFTMNYGATSSNMKLVHWPLMGDLLHWYNEDGTGWGHLAVPNVTAHRPTASVPITVLLHNCLLGQMSICHLSNNYRTRTRWHESWDKISRLTHSRFSVNTSSSSDWHLINHHKQHSLQTFSYLHLIFTTTSHHQSNSLHQHSLQTFSYLHLIFTTTSHHQSNSLHQHSLQTFSYLHLIFTTTSHHHRIHCVIFKSLATSCKFPVNYYCNYTVSKKITTHNVTKLLNLHWTTQNYSSFFSERQTQCISDWLIQSKQQPRNKEKRLQNSKK